GGALEDLAHGVELKHLGRAEAADDEAATRGRLDEALDHEPAEGLADRRPADIELAGDILLAQAVAGLQVAGAERSPERAEDAFAERQAGRGGIELQSGGGDATVA